MDWKGGKWKLNLKSGKNKWLAMLALGLIFLILALPTGGAKGRQKADSWLLSEGEAQGEPQDTEGKANLNPSEAAFEAGDLENVQASAKAALTYEQQMEQRLEEILSRVDGVGKVEVMIVLKSSEEKVWRVDRDTSYAVTQETDQNGGSRRVESQEISEDTILTGQSGQEGPILEKEMRPEISGVVVSAEGGKSPQVQAEISAAVEALFDIPSHKIKVLKRVE